MTQVVTHTCEVPAKIAAEVEAEAQRALIEMGYGRLGLTPDEMPALHFAKHIEVGEGFIRVQTGSPAAQGANLLFMPMPFINERGKIAIDGSRSYLQPIRCTSASVTNGSTHIVDPWCDNPVNLEVSFDPNGVDLRQRWTDILPAAVMSAEITRSKSPLRRFANAIGL